MIKQSQLSHRFRVNIPDHAAISQFVKKCSFDYKNKLIQLVIKQSADDTDLIHLAIFQLINNKIDITYDQLDGSGKVLSSNVFSGSKIISHQHQLDYSSEEPVYHQLTFEFVNMATIAKY